MQQVTMGGVNLHDFGAGRARTARRGRKGLHDAGNLGGRERLRNLISLREGYRTGSEDRGPSAFLWRERPATLPRLARAGLAPGVSQLNARHSSLLLDERKDS